MEEKVDLLTRQYELYEVECLESYKDVCSYLRKNSRIISKDLKCLETDKKRNSFFARYAKQFRSLIDYKSSSFFRCANVFVEQLIVLCNGYGSLIHILEDRVNEENYADIYRLARFTMDGYENDLDIVQDNADCELCRFNGIEGSKNDEPIVLDDVFKSFFKRQVRKISLSKGYQKVKK